MKSKISKEINGNKIELEIDSEEMGIAQRIFAGIPSRCQKCGSKDITLDNIRRITCHNCQGTSTCHLKEGEFKWSEFENNKQNNEQDKSENQ